MSAAVAMKLNLTARDATGQRKFAVRDVRADTTVQELLNGLVPKMGLPAEDSTGTPENPIRSLDDAVARLRAARTAIDQAGGEALLVGRAENFFVGRADLDDTIARLRAYADAGADCLYAPGIRSRAHIEAVVKAVAPKPVNLLVGSVSEFTLQDVAAMGVRRVSVGGGLARAAWGGFLRAARGLAEGGRFDGFDGAAAGDELNAAFAGATRPDR